jgi:hypothetical protein
MPGAVPGAGGPPMPAGGLPPGALPAPARSAGVMPAGAVPGAPPAFLPPGSESGGLPEYITETQADGSILLRLKNPDGTPGVVMKVINAVKPRQNPYQQGAGPV